MCFSRDPLYECIDEKTSLYYTCLGQVKTFLPLLHCSAWQCLGASFVKVSLICDSHAPHLVYLQVRKYDPKAAKKAAAAAEKTEEWLTSPITGEMVPASKVQDHMRIGLLDPRWVEERDKQITAK